MLSVIIIISFFMELPTTMLFLMLQEISLPVALSVIIPFYFVCIFFSLMEKGCFQYILAIVQHYLVEYIMYISITFPHSGQFFSVQIHLGGTDIGIHCNGSLFFSRALHSGAVSGKEPVPCSSSPYTRNKNLS